MGSLELGKGRGARTDGGVRSSFKQFAILYPVEMVNALMTKAFRMFQAQLWKPAQQALSLTAFPSCNCVSVCTGDRQYAKGKLICGALLDWGTLRAG